MTNLEIAHMKKLLGAIDVSGRPKIGNYLYIAIVICTEERYNTIRNYPESQNIDLNAPKTNRL